MALDFSTSCRFPWQNPIPPPDQGSQWLLVYHGRLFRRSKRNSTSTGSIGRVRFSLAPGTADEVTWLRPWIEERVEWAKSASRNVKMKLGKLGSTCDKRGLGGSLSVHGDGHKTNNFADLSFCTKFVQIYCSWQRSFQQRFMKTHCVYPGSAITFSHICLSGQSSIVFPKRLVLLRGFQFSWRKMRGLSKRNQITRKYAWVKPGN